MRHLLAAALGLAAVLYVATAAAYTLECGDQKCDVKCDNGQMIGTMYWNGSRWSDGLRSDPDKHVVAKQMVAAWGTSCT